MLSNIPCSNEKVKLVINLKSHDLPGLQWYDILSKKTVKARNGILELNLDPYDILWLKEVNRRA